MSRPIGPASAAIHPSSAASSTFSTTGATLSTTGWFLLGYLGFRQASLHLEPDAAALFEIVGLFPSHRQGRYRPEPNTS